MGRPGAILAFFFIVSVLTRIVIGAGYIRSLPGLRRRRFDLSARAGIADQSASLLPPRHELRRPDGWRRSYITSGLPQTAFIRRSSAEDMLKVSARRKEEIAGPRSEELNPQR